MPKTKPPAHGPMSVQPSGHGSTVATQSMPRLPRANSKTTTPRQKGDPDDGEVRAARAREGIRLEALTKQRKAMKR
jgi:hypothetical protein